MVICIIKTIIVTISYISYMLNAEPRALYPICALFSFNPHTALGGEGTTTLESERPGFEFWLPECLQTPALYVLHEELA